MSGDSSPIDEYLDRLARELRLDPLRNRRVLKEAEDHLREAAAEGAAAGTPAQEAEQQAIARFGPPRTIARRFAAAQGGLLPPSTLLHLVLALGLLAGTGLVAIGISGGVAQAMGSLFGARFVAGDTNGVTYTPARCRDFMEYEPAAPDCETAATLHHFGEVVDYRAAAGVLGALVLGAYALVRRRYRSPAGVRILPEAFVPTAGAALFGAASAVLLLQGVGQALAGDTTGTGGYLSGGVVAAVFLVAFALPLVKLLRAREEPQAA